MISFFKMRLELLCPYGTICTRLLTTEFCRNLISIYSYLVQWVVHVKIQLLFDHTVQAKKFIHCIAYGCDFSYFPLLSNIIISLVTFMKCSKRFSSSRIESVESRWVVHAKIQLVFNDGTCQVIYTLTCIRMWLLLYYPWRSNRIILLVIYMKGSN